MELKFREPQIDVTGPAGSRMVSVSLVAGAALIVARVPFDESPDETVAGQHARIKAIAKDYFVAAAAAL